MTENNGLKKGFRALQIPPGDDKERSVCTDCGHIDYGNPKIISGTVSTWENKVLLCRRAIPPRIGFWTLTAGYLEKGESIEDGAERETQEEAAATAEIDALLAIYSIPQASQVHMIFRAAMKSPDCGPSKESLESRLFEWDDIPWDDLAFPVTRLALQYWHKTRETAGGLIVPERRTLTPFSPNAQPKPPAP